MKLRLCQRLKDNGYHRILLQLQSAQGVRGTVGILQEIEVRYKFVKTDCDLIGSVLDSPVKVKNAFQFLKYEPRERLIVVNLSKGEMDPIV